MHVRRTIRKTQTAIGGIVNWDAIASILASSSTSTSPVPALPGGAIVAWAVCNGTKRNQIGGWLLLYYWQLFSGLLMAIVLFSLNIQSYVPENFDANGRYLLFLASAGPGLILLLVEVAVGTMLLSVRTWDLLKLLRWVIAAQIIAALVSTAIDVAYFPDNVGLNFLIIIPECIWLAYLFRSVRVKHVFQTHDWDIAVNSIHPRKLKMAS
jgi:hypothetical protein